MFSIDKVKTIGRKIFSCDENCSLLITFIYNHTAVLATDIIVYITVLVLNYH